MAKAYQPVLRANSPPLSTEVAGQRLNLILYVVSLLQLGIPPYSARAVSTDERFDQELISPSPHKIVSEPLLRTH